MSHDNIKSQRKQGLYPFCRKYSFEITIGDGHIDPSLFRVKGLRLESLEIRRQFCNVFTRFYTISHPDICLTLFLNPTGCMTQGIMINDHISK